jgi:hypothetical protein
MSHSEQSAGDAGPQSSLKIPPLTNIAPSIFVPLQDDILTTELPRNRVELLQAILRSIDYQREGVKENLLCMFEREKQRIMQEAAEKEQAAGPPKMRPGLPPSEVDAFIANMEALPEPGVDYNVKEWPANRRLDNIPLDISPRDRAVMELLKVVERGVEELGNFEKYMEGIRQHYVDTLTKEVAYIDEAGKRPEERAGAERV